MRVFPVGRKMMLIEKTDPTFIFGTSKNEKMNKNKRVDKFCFEHFHFFNTTFAKLSKKFMSCRNQT